MGKKNHAAKFLKDMKKELKRKAKKVNRKMPADLVASYEAIKATLEVISAGKDFPLYWRSGDMDSVDSIVDMMETALGVLQKDLKAFRKLIKKHKTK